MMRRTLVAAMALLFVAGLVVAAEMKEASGMVKEVLSNSITVTDSAAKDWTFAVDSKETLVVAKGGSHKLDQLKADGKPAVISEFLSENQTVAVKYLEKDGKMIAKKVLVKQP